MLSERDRLSCLRNCQPMKLICCRDWNCDELKEELSDRELLFTVFEGLSAMEQLSPREELSPVAFAILYFALKDCVNVQR